MSGRILVCLFAAAILSSAAATQSGALISGASVSTSGSNGSGNSADGSTTFSAAIQTNNGVTLATRYGFNVNSDIGIFSTDDQSGTAQHNISFNATAPGGYRLDVSTQRVGDLNRINDLSGCDGQAHVSGVTGSSNVGWSGSLDLPGYDLNNGGSTTSTPFNDSSSATIFKVSNGSAQAHTLTFTWTGSTRSNSCEAAVRIGEGSGSTTGCSACGYAGSPSRNQATDGHFVSITFTSLCGNSTIDSSVGEQCDQGASNGTASSCCTAQCRFKANGTECRPVSAGCDQAESCTGSSANCPADTFLPSGTVCRAASPGEVCDQDEVCTGSSKNCPADLVKPSGTVCRNSAGSCDLTETCDGASKLCPTDAKVPNGTSCRNATGDCDVAETCNGVSNLCPANGFKSAGTSCRASAGSCDIAETCPGNSPNCPADQFQPNTTPCRSATGDCDQAENCSGVGPTCPADAVKASGTLCRAIGGICDIQENCDGVSKNCPADQKKPSGTACSPDTNPCTVDQCDGTNVTCQHPAGNAGAVCRLDTGACDVAELCNGTSTACPADGFEPPGTACPDDGETCTVDQCNGSGSCTHPAGNAGVTCRAGTPGQVCDVDEVCDGSSPTCPADQVQPSGTTCRTSTPGEVCDVDEACDGTSSYCPEDAVKPAGTVCRPDAGDCDVQEVCDGSNKFCPANSFEPFGTTCTSDGQPCTVDRCNGSGTCTHPAGNAGTLCRAAAGECDLQEVCNGTSTTCPANAFKSSGTACSSDGETCTADQCNGSGACTHPAGNAGVQCRAVAGICDVAESCDGTTPTCPPDGFVGAGTECRADAGQCDVPEQCTGSAASCPADGFEPDGTTCSDGQVETANDMCMAGTCEGTLVAGTLDPFKCYKAKDLRMPKFTSALVTLQDQFSTENGIAVKKPFLLCNPTEMNNDPINNPTGHLTCYKIKANALTPAQNLQVGNIFGASQKLQVRKPFLLCLPSTKSVIP